MVKWFSFYDAQEQKMVFGKTNLVTYLVGISANIAPTLTIQTSTNGFTIAWPAQATGYVLESRNSLSTNVWQTVNQPHITVGTQQMVIWSNSESATFFRLRQTGAGL